MRLPKIILFFSLLLSATASPHLSLAEDYTIFDDKSLLDGYAQKYLNESKDILLEMIKDDTLSPYIGAAALRVFKEKFSKEVFGHEKAVIEKNILHRLSRTNSKFVEIEAAHTLCLMDRYQYFDALVPSMIQLLDHYNETVSELAFSSLTDITAKGSNRPREARIVFNVLRKNFFVNRRKLANIKEPGSKLKRKLELLRWSIKVLGNPQQELKRLPSEILDLL